MFCKMHPHSSVCSVKHWDSLVNMSLCMLSSIRSPLIWCVVHGARDPQVFCLFSEGYREMHHL